MENRKNYSNATQRLPKNKTSLLAVISILFLLLLGYNGASIFSIHLPFPSKSPIQPERRNSFTSSTKLASSELMYVVKQEDPVPILKTHLPLLRKPASFSPENEDPVQIRRTHSRKSHSIAVKRRRNPLFKILRSESPPDQFSSRMKEFLGNKSMNSSCKVRFFMTWISPSASFGDRELFAIESLFKSHPIGCLVIVSNSMDSRKGEKILQPFLDKGFRVTAISPDFDYLVKHTVAESWFERLKSGNLDPGEVSLGQNLSNLLRLLLLYKFGGIYVDTDVIVLRSLSELKNSIGAQTMDLSTQKWSRLNNAVMVFDKNHPLLYKFIEEFALTFDGNKWGHNGPYLVSRVVNRVSGRPGFNFTVLPPVAFYPVDWSRVRSLFRGPKDTKESKWLFGKLKQIQSKSSVVHLWNKQSKGLKIEEGSIIHRLISDRCVFCNTE